jgi:hypothetical protein
LPLPASHLTPYWFLENQKHQVCLAEIFHCNCSWFPYNMQFSRDFPL